jgi:hypothetical protein
MSWQDYSGQLAVGFWNEHIWLLNDWGLVVKLAVFQGAVGSRFLE